MVFVKTCRNKNSSTGVKFMSAIWTILMLSSLTVLIISSPQTALSAMLSGSKNAVDLAIKLIASYAFWMGLFSLLEKLKITNLLAKILKKPIRFLFPNESEETEKFITMNVSANLLGLGNASTPMGINAIKNMYHGKTTDNISTFIVLSATSLQILPTTVISMRVEAGSTSPMSIFIPSLVATVISTTLGIIICKTIQKVRSKNKKCNVLGNTYLKKADKSL
jgi:spore maturation protein A